MVEKIFFNSSLPRSGSTLLQNIMAQNQKFYVTPTSGVLELVFGARANYTNSPEFKAQDAEKYSGKEIIRAIHIITDAYRKAVSSSCPRQLLLEHIALQIVNGK